MEHASPLKHCKLECSFLIVCHFHPNLVFAGKASVEYETPH